MSCTEYMLFGKRDTMSASYTPYPHPGTSPQDHCTSPCPTSVFTQLPAIPRWGIKLMSQG